ncbi:MAG: hypothetical protein ACX94B_16910 [Henriciella sp.]
MSTETSIEEMLNRYWQGVHESERRAWDVLMQADLDDMAATPKKELTRQWWREASIALRFFQNARTRYGVSLLPFPGELFALLANVTEEIAEGVPIELVRVSKGGHQMTRQQRLDVKAAIHYIEAAHATSEPKSKRIDEVANEYGTDDRTIKGWIGEFRSKYVTPFDDAMLLSSDDLQCLKRDMLEAAERYKNMRKTRKRAE